MSTSNKQEMASFFSTTFGRKENELKLVNEMIFHFTKQDYPNCELIIVNDDPNTIMKTHVENVAIFNLSKRFKTLGEKLNFAVSCCKGSILLPQDDDDISLQNRASQAVKMLKGFDYWNPQSCWFETKEGLHYKHKHGVCHNCSAFRKEVFQKISYKKTSKAQDAIIDKELKEQVKVNYNTLGIPYEWSYIYRWGIGSNLHLSAFDDPNVVYANNVGSPYQRIVYLNGNSERNYNEICRNVFPCDCDSNGCNCKR